MAEHTLVGGQKLTKVHPPDKCIGEYCCIHNPSDHHMVEWEQNWRQDRRVMERICSHGVGHPDPDDPKATSYYESIHGCDGCCCDPFIDNKVSVNPTNRNNTVDNADEIVRFEPTKLSRKEKLLEIASMVSNDDCYCDVNCSQICNHVVENKHSINGTAVPSTPIVYPTMHTTPTSTDSNDEVTIIINREVLSRYLNFQEFVPAVHNIMLQTLEGKDE